MNIDTQYISSKTWSAKTMRWFSKVKLKNPIPITIKSHHFKLIRQKRFIRAALLKQIPLIIFIPIAFYGAYLKAQTYPENSIGQVIAYFVFSLMPLTVMMYIYYDVQGLKLRFTNSFE
jgi:hypothetical protein